MSVLSVLFFLLILRLYGVRDQVLGALALAFTPVVYIESTGMMDYVNALACMLGATYAILTGRIAVAGLLVGLAAGFRASSAAMFLPLAVFLLASDRHESRACWRLMQVARLAAVSGTVTLLLYAEPLATYGAGLFESYEKVQRPWLPAIWIATVGVFGVPGAAAVAAGLTQAVLRSSLRTSGATSIPDAPHRADLFLWLSAAAIPVLIFLWQPSESGYIVPAIPFILLILARYASRWVFVATCVALCVSPWLGQFTPRFGDLVPSMPGYQAKRVAEMKQIEALWDELAVRPGRTLVIAAGYAPKLMLTQPEETRSRVKLISWATAEIITSEQSAGGEVLCFAEACRWNVGRTGTDPIQFGARAFPDR